MAVPLVQGFIQHYRSTWRRARETLIRAGECTKIAVECHRRLAPRYVCGQRVWLSTKDLPLPVPVRKVAPRFISPYPIVKVISPVAVQLRLTHPFSHVHPVFHVSKIKPVLRSPHVPSVSFPAPSPPLMIMGAPAFIVRSLLDSRRCAQGFQYFVD